MVNDYLSKILNPEQQKYQSFQNAPADVNDQELFSIFLNKWFLQNRFHIKNLSCIFFTSWKNHWHFLFIITVLAAKM
jgi:hypothetical protein